LASAAGLPNAEYIKKQIRIAAVCEELDLRVRGKNAHCWRTENHQHGDRTPSISLHKNRFRCHVCDEHQGSNIDLVMAVQGVDFHAAIAWLAERFPDIPRIPKRAVRSAPVHRDRAGCYDLRDDIEESGVLTLPMPRKIKDKETGRVEIVCKPISYGARFVVLALVRLLRSGSRAISYPELMRRANVTSKTHVGEAIRYVQHFGLVSVERQYTDVDLIHRTSIYHLTADSEKFQAHVRRCYQQRREQEEAEIRFLQARKAERRATRATQRRQSSADGVDYLTPSFPALKTENLPLQQDLTPGERAYLGKASTETVPMSRFQGTESVPQEEGIRVAGAGNQPIKKPPVPGIGTRTDPPAPVIGPGERAQIAEWRRSLQQWLKQRGIDHYLPSGMTPQLLELATRCSSIDDLLAGIPPGKSFISAVDVIGFCREQVTVSKKSEELCMSN
jgi:CHC2 zinc finger